MRIYFSNLTVFVRRYYFFLLLLALFIVKLAIVIPRFPTAGLDPSWGFGLSVAASRHLIFGKDVIYTFGPLSTLYSGFWTPAGHALTVLLSFIIAFGLSYFVYQFFAKAGYLVKLLLVVFFFISLWGGTDFSYSLLPALAVLNLIDDYSNNKKKSYAAVIILFAFIAALLLLVKLSFGVESFLALIILLGFYAIKKDLKSSILLIATFLFSFVVLYLASGQKLSGIIYYPLNIYYGVAGYNDAMSFPGPVEPVIASAVFLILLISYFAFISLKHFKVEGIFSLLVIALLSLVVFKHSYVRNDTGHQSDIYLLQIFYLICLIYVLPSASAGLSIAKNTLITACVLSLLCFGFKNDTVFFSGEDIKHGVTKLITIATNTDRIFDEAKNNSDYENSVKSIRAGLTLPVLQGTSDIFNYNQAVLLASGNTWNPRPAFQSYQAVTSYLSEANYGHFLNQNTAPDNVFFRVESIDWRIPSLADGLSWKALLGLYKPNGWTDHNDYLILQRDNSSDKPLTAKDSKNIVGKLGQEITIPYESGLVFVKLNIRKSILGRMLSVAYKVEPVWIKLKLHNGQERMFRIVPSMAETGFLLSPLTETTMDFSNLYRSGYFADSSFGKTVKSLTISTESPYQYHDSFDLTFEQLTVPDKSKSVVSKPKKNGTVNFRIEPDVQFYVDNFIYKFTGDHKLYLDFNGWAFKKNLDIQTSSYSLIFAAQNGESESLEVPLAQQNRGDVSKYFNDGHNYELCGYSVNDLFDGSDFKSKTEYKLYLRMIINGNEYIVSLNKSLAVN